MEPKYVPAEEIDFQKANEKHIYIGNYEGIEYIDVSNYVKNSDVENFNYTFALAESNNLKFKGIKLDSKNIKSFNYTFKYLIIDSLDLSEFETSNAVSFRGTFKLFKCKNLNISNFKTDKALDLISMFDTSEIEVLDLSSFHFNNDVDASFMFEKLKCRELTLPESFPLYPSETMFYESKIKIIKTPSIEFYEENKEYFKKEHNTELILI